MITIMVVHVCTIKDIRFSTVICMVSDRKYYINDHKGGPKILEWTLLVINTFRYKVISIALSDTYH